jgi:DNA-binding NarL/FixJ family response regulator
MKLRVLIVDDEALARVRVRKMLAEEPDVEVLGECANGPEAITAIRQHRPDLVFLDVQLPEVSGFDVLRALAPDEMVAQVSKPAVSPTSQSARRTPTRVARRFGNLRHSRLGSLRYVGCGFASASLHCYP